MEMKVYIIDDDLTICTSLHWFFETIGIDSAYFKSASEFLMYYKPSLKGCILLDIRMHKMSGFELHEELSRLTNTMPVIFMTGHCGSYVSEYCHKNNIFAYIEKPFDFDELIDLINRACAIS